MANELLNNALTYQTLMTPQAKLMQQSIEDSMERAELGQAAAYGSVIVKGLEAEKQDSPNSQDDCVQNPQESNEWIHKEMEKLNKNYANAEAVFGIREDTKKLVIKITDKDTKEVICEVSAEKTLDVIARVWEMTGILLEQELEM